ncbi:probable leucine-rich repeat receptor-like protein kinase At1g35710 [Solanum verrucosum]|uniref:probable leucine-rich repeat receptor-like protein kinase At1g35710 n=1 Tax=Solanum verrucosum TaxID=315347 RepID=UPI0020D19A9A|nr:probable leucine-rich repeat receptor-like protein kinase At1g35710 [Solanum verrucosum]
MVPKIVQFLILLYLFTVTFAFNEEEIALLKWKATFKNQTNSLLASWTQSSNACMDWYGVMCLNGRVSKLDIQGAHVIGTLYDFPFSTLPFLEYVDLSVNNLSGTIPPEISNLTNLVYLDLHTNMISGTIPFQIGSLANLQNINIYDNLLNGFIPASLSYLRSLTSLDLGTNSLNGFIPALLGNLTSLSILYLQENNLSGSTPEEIGYLRSLSQLVLAKNSLSGVIPASLGNLAKNSLSYLDFSTNFLSGSIPTSLGNLNVFFFWQLEKLAMDVSPHSNNLTEKIPLSFCNLIKLEVVYLGKQLEGRNSAVSS